MDAFEELFKTKAQTPPSCGSTLKMKVARKSSSKISLLEPNRAKNLAITLHKGGMDAKKICTAIETYVPFCFSHKYTYTHICQIMSTISDMQLTNNK